MNETALKRRAPHVYRTICSASEFFFPGESNIEMKLNEKKEEEKKMVYILHAPTEFGVNNNYTQPIRSIRKNGITHEITETISLC